MRIRASWWPTPSATWCVGPSAHQASKNAAGPEAKRIREFVLPIRKVGPAIDSPSAAISFSRPSAVCVSAEDRHRPEPHLHLDREAGAGLAVVELERPRDRPPVGDREVAGAVVPHQDELLVEVERVELGVGAAGAEPVEQEHRDVRLQVALAGGRDAARGEQRVADDQAGRDALGDVAADAAVVVGQPVELEVLDQAVEPDRDARRPLEDLGRDLGRRSGRRPASARSNVCADLVALALDRRGVRRLDPRRRGRRSRAPRRARRSARAPA